MVKCSRTVCHCLPRVRQSDSLSDCPTARPTVQQSDSDKRTDTHDCGNAVYRCYRTHLPTHSHFRETLLYAARVGPRSVLLIANCVRTDIEGENRTLRIQSHIAGTIQTLQTQSLHSPDTNRILSDSINYVRRGWSRQRFDSELIRRSASTPPPSSWFPGCKM